jgi:hypothetical protein
MIEPIADMPPGTIGFKAEGDVSAENLKDVALEPLRAAVEAGEPLRILTVVGHLHEEPRAIWASLKADAEFGFLHRDSWKRTAVVSDLGWAKRLSKLFGWAVPGKFKVFDGDQLEAAKAWLVEEG